MVGSTLAGIFARPGNGGPTGITGGNVDAGGKIGGPTGPTGGKPEGGKTDGGSEAAGTTAGPTGGSSAIVGEPDDCVVENTGG